MSYIDTAKEIWQEKNDLKREAMDRAAVASGNVDENSAMYRHAKLNGWDLGKDDEESGKAGRKWVAAERADRGRMLSAQADMVNSQLEGKKTSGISMFAADGEGNFSSFDFDDNIRNGFNELENRINTEEAEASRRKQATLSWAYGNALRNGGMVRKEMMPAIRKELGRNDLLGAAVAKDGNMILLGGGNNGSIYPMGIVKAENVLSAAMKSGDYDTADAIGANLENYLTPSQLSSMGWSKDATKKGRQNKVAATVAERERQMQMEIIEKMKQDSVQTFGDFIEKNPEIVKGYMFEPARDESGQILVGEKGDAVMVPVSAEDAIKKLRTIFDEVANGELWNQRNYQMTDMIEASKRREAAAMKREQDLMDMRLLDYGLSRTPMVNFYYRNKNGGLTLTNGRVLNGRAYDAYGNELKGVQPLNKDGSAMTNGNIPADAALGTSVAQGANTTTEASAETKKGYGLRNDGTPKGQGWLGELKLPDGSVATEYSVGVNIGGKEMDIPTLVPTLDPWEAEYMAKIVIPNKMPIPKEILEKAVDFAKGRMAQGKSPFRSEDEETLPDYMRGIQQSASQNRIPSQNNFSERWGNISNEARKMALRKELHDRGINPDSIQ